MLEAIPAKPPAQTSQLQRLNESVTAAIIEKNLEREKLGKAPLRSYYQDYVMLQEVSKAALFHACGSMTLAHTSDNINPSSVTSFYEVGLACDLYSADDIVAYVDKGSADGQ